MKYLSRVLILVSVICLLFSCEQKEEPKLGSICGTVVDNNTSKPIKNAGVELKSIGLKTVTGSDGYFEFKEISEGEYTLYITKSGYKSYTSSKIRVIGTSTPQKVDVHLELLPPALTIIDDKRKEIDYIDFGAGETVQKSFGIFNNSDDNLEWDIVPSECAWIKSFSKNTGTLKPNQTQSIVCTIDRNKLNIGENSTIVHIVSNNGSKELKIIATSVEVIETLDISDEDIDSHSAVFQGKVIRNLDPIITEYGFVYSTNETPTLTNGAQKVSNFGSPQIGTYEMQADNLEKETIYYVRAFVTNGDKTYYGNQIDFCTISHTPYIILYDNNSSAGPTKTAKTITVTYTVSNDGGLPIEEVGVCWDTNRVPTKDKQYLKTGDKKESYKKITITDLLPNTTYYVRAYVRNSEEENYSAEISVKTMNGTPAVEIVSSYNEGKDYLIVSGVSSSPDNIPIQRQGICYSTSNSTPTIYDQCQDAEDLSSNNFTCQLTGLNGCTTYHCRAFVKNEYDIAYSEKIIHPNTLCEPAMLKGYVYDQDGNPIQGAKVGIGKGNGTYSNDSYKITNNEGYYEMTLNIESSTSLYILATKDGFVAQNKNVLLIPEQTQSQDFNLSLVTPCDIDLGTGFWADGPSHLLFDCSQSSLAGTTSQRNIRIKNYRSIPVSYNFSNIPTVGVKFSNTSGTIPANGEISLTATLTYPSTNNSQVVSLPNCTAGHRAYVWNWENIVVGQYVYTAQIVDNHTQVGVAYLVSYSDCCACCQQNIFVSIGDVQAGFTLTFNQFVTYK